MAAGMRALSGGEVLQGGVPEGRLGVGAQGGVWEGGGAAAAGVGCVGEGPDMAVRARRM